MSVTAIVSNIARASLHDGPGVRTVVYFKGCALRCAWCHNPETFDTKSEILFASSKCIRCGNCVALCPAHHRIDGNKLALVRKGCRRCGACADACPAGALSLCGEEMTVDEVMRVIRKDAAYYAQSGGGVTLSGGECLLQAEFCAALLGACRDEGIHTAVETALFVPWESVQQVLPFCDLVFADCKIADGAKHRQYTGQGNAHILSNLDKLTALYPQKVTVRIPLIPTVNDTAEDAAAFARVLGPLSERLAGVEVLRYNALASSKYIQAGRAYTDFGEPQTDEQLLRFCQAIADAGGPVCTFC